MTKKALTPILLLSLLAPAARALDLESHPGYADLSALESAGHPTAQLDFDRAALASLLGAVAADDPQLAALADSVARVRIRAFDLDAGRVEEVRARLADTADGLRAAGWATLASVRDDEDVAYVFMRSDGPHVAGLVAMFGGDGEAGYVHVMGEIDPAQAMAAAMGNFQSLRQLASAAKDETDSP